MALSKKDPNYHQTGDNHSCLPIMNNQLQHDLPLFCTQLSPYEQVGLFINCLAACPLAVLITNQHGIIEYVNHKFMQVTDYEQQELTSLKIGKLLRKVKAFSLYRDVVKSLATKQMMNSLEFKFQTKFGHIKWQVLTIIKNVNDEGQLTHYITFLEDVTERKQKEETIEHMAFYDQLTDLPNRAMFDSRLKLAIKHAYRSGDKVAVGLVDLDRFKNINDTLGHAVGDDFIKLVGQRLFECLEENHTLARMGGDEFMILLTDIKNFKDVFKTIQNIMDTFNSPFLFANQELHIKASMGIALFPEDGDDAQSLVKNADTALHEAKNLGRNHYKFYTAKLNASAFEQLTLETALRQALELEQFAVYYQPQVNLKTGKIIGMEALVRWMHPEMGLVPPVQFIPLAEETGLIVPLGEWVLRTACQQTLSWQQMGFAPLRLAVNLSARQFQEPELVETVLGICKQTGLAPQSLELEITESILMKDISIATMILKWLNKKGVRIAIDDFGTGYSSLAYLKKFPINNLKIDRSFIRDCLTNKDDAAIVSSIASIANNLNLKIIAEGVETEDQLKFINDVGCNEIQGYYFSPPVPPAEFAQMLKQDKSISRQLLIT